MTTQRLYYDDSSTLNFDAAVVEITTYQDRPAIVLDRTFFYPEGGGQEPDHGLLNGAHVIDVQTRESDRAVLHVIEGAVSNFAEGIHIEGQIEGARRQDRMQHHSAQHILTAALSEAARAETVSVHMSDTMTIDVDRADLTLDDLVAAEELANQVVLENRVVRCWFPEPEELATLTLRKLPDVVGKVRVVDMGGFDMTACGGTHVARTAETGAIKIIRADRRGTTMRVEFKSGWRALRDYRDKNTILNQLAADLTVGYWEIGNAIVRFQVENKALRADLKTAKEALIDSEAIACFANAESIAAGKLVSAVFDGRDAGDLKLLMQKTTAQPGAIVLLGNAGEKSALMFGRANDVAIDMVPLLKVALKAIGSERGGGQPSLAQGGGVPATVPQLEAALQAAIAVLDEKNSA
jgi:alanyl-tRNA synthetase